MALAECGYGRFCGDCSSSVWPAGAGKSTLARELTDSVAGVRFSIDEWVSELYVPDAPKPLRLDWVMARVQRCEHRIWALASEVAKRGVDVVLDLGFMRAASRAAFQRLAEREGLAVQMHFVTAPLETRRRRVATRNQEKGDTYSSEVTPAMFGVMENEFELPDEHELSLCTVMQTA